MADLLLKYSLEILTGLLFFATAYYAWVAHQSLEANRESVEAMRDQSEKMIRPYIVIRPEFSKKAIYYLLVSNKGKTPAENLELNVDPSFETQSGFEDIGDAYLFREGVGALAPGAEIRFMLGHGAYLFRDDEEEESPPMEFQVTAEYSYAGKRVEETTTVDLRQYRGMVLHKTMVDKNLKKSRKALETIADTIEDYDRR